MSIAAGQQRLIGESPAFLEVLEHSSAIAQLEKPVLVVGERGTGKELIASRIHYLSKRWDQSYLQTNCAALNDELIDSDLFGHEAGAFTGATKRHIGRFERANGGTLFLDELATLSGRIQDRPLWLSVAGGGVPWLHVRIDDRPKYYRYDSYRTAV